MAPNKEDLLQLCYASLDKRLQGLKRAQAAVDESMSGAVKSSAGDKHNTERAHLQLQSEKLGQQFKVLDQQRLVLSKIITDSVTGRVHLGSLVQTDQQWYFLSIPAGELILNDSSFWAIAPQSPIGQLLLGKAAGDSFSWNGKSQEIKAIY
ncbi:3-oxoacyl-ACP synthase [Gilvibacter sp.]|uniref:3-oxoacyl-ACP synthase n=1 Tax=Gilvibacter sp. TaxID=2729997 RepID=UPI0025C02B3D|nr:3-oxoacyl-ACP synthase [Gilvibacter sp.]NQX76704.1 GreA/GreB family elongation factor [Gilvibacter sp.]